MIVFPCPLLRRGMGMDAGGDEPPVFFCRNTVVALCDTGKSAIIIVGLGRFPSPYFP